MSRADALRWLPFAAIAALVFALPTLLQDGAIHRVATSLDLLPREASFTELWIEQTDHLQNAVHTNGNARITLVAMSKGQADKHYRWTLRVGPDGKQVTIQTGEFELQPNQTREWPINFTIRDCHARNHVTITLAGPDRRAPEVGFWVLDRSSKSWQQDGGANCGN